MSSTLLGVTYKRGKTTQYLEIPKELYDTNFIFRTFVIHTKCLDCKLEFNFTGEQS